jgi:predicted nucleotidyltransferase
VAKAEPRRQGQLPGREKIVDLLRERQDEIRERFSVKSLALFGSSARGDAHGGSDIDLLVEFDRPVGFFKFCELEDFLSDVLGGAEVDLVLRRAVIEDLKDVIYGGAVDVIG